ncbi:radical SAM protein [Streptomonospora nanhaiensis]
MTRKCQLNCSHCYNSSGPTEEHGTMTRDSWLALVDQAATVGVEHIQLIGGEPTLHPDAGDVANRALEYGISVEVYSNLVHLTDAWWDFSNAMECHWPPPTIPTAPRNTIGLPCARAIAIRGPT